jgi:outer membrane murein-binding lipoprotein Lpp
MRASLAIAGALLIVGCGSTVPPPTSQYSVAQQEIARAQQVGADKVPEAAPHLQAAQQNLDKANERINGQYKDYERATSLVDRSRAEADLAFMLTREAQLKTGAAEAHAKLNSLPPPGQAIGPQPTPDTKKPAKPKKQAP